jgi:hypothetical protein
MALDYQGAIVARHKRWQSGADEKHVSGCQALQSSHVIGRRKLGLWPTTGEIMKKAALFVILMAIVLAMASTSFAATSVASVHGVYSFQMQGLTNQTGYYSGSWVNLNGKACPKGQFCFDQAFTKVTYGTLSFDGKGHVTFLSITNINQGTGGPVKGSIWTYSVSGFNGAIGTATNGAYLSLGNFSAAGIAQTVFIRTPDSSPMLGVAILQ